MSTEIIEQIKKNIEEYDTDIKALENAISIQEERIRASRKDDSIDGEYHREERRNYELRRAVKAQAKVDFESLLLFADEEK